MKNSQNGKLILTTSLIVICVISIILSLSLAQRVKNSEAKFKKDRAILVREKMELKDELDALKDDLKSKADDIASLENERRIIKEQIAGLEKASADLKGASLQEVESLRQQIQSLRKDAEVFKDASSIQVLQDAAARETDATIKRILADALTKLTMVKDGKAVTLEPIVITGGADSAAVKQGKIVSFDKKNALIVVNLGSANGVRDGQRLKILGEQGEIAIATVIRTRYEISAAFIESFRSKHTIQDLREDLAITIE